MKITIEKKQTEEVEVLVPCYIKSYCHFFYVPNEKQCISVSDNCIEICHAELPFNGTVSDARPCTKEEFEDAYINVAERISGLAFPDRLISFSEIPMSNSKSNYLIL